MLPPSAQTQPPQAEVEQSDEALAVQRWRRRQLRQAGYPTPLAIILADDLDVDLHVAVGLLERGCPVEVAARILGWPL